MSFRVLFIDSNHPLLHETLEKGDVQCDLNYGWPEEKIAERLADYDGIVIRSRIRLTKTLIDKGTNLKFIARAGAGMENIDVAYAESKGIRCLNSPEGNMDAVAEQAIGMLLALFNNLCRANREVREGKWIREGNRGLELMGKTVGVIGYGNTGSSFVKRLTGFGVRILVYDKYKKGFAAPGIEEVEMDTLQREADILSLHVPLNDETRFMVNDAFLQKFKKNIFFVNTSRGKVVNTADLVLNLQNGRVKGACLDVLEYESVSFENLDSSVIPPPLQYLFKAENVMLSPHIAGWTQESNWKIAKVLAEKILKLKDQLSKS